MSEMMNEKDFVLLFKRRDELRKTITETLHKQNLLQNEGIGHFSNPLIHVYDNYDSDGDYLLLYATDIEQQLRSAGAIPLIDYTILDCFKLAIEKMRSVAMMELSNAIKESKIDNAIYEISNSLDRIEKI